MTVSSLHGRVAEVQLNSLWKFCSCTYQQIHINIVSLLNNSSLLTEGACTVSWANWSTTWDLANGFPIARNNYVVCNNNMDYNYGKYTVLTVSYWLRDILFPRRSRAWINTCVQNESSLPFTSRAWNDQTHCRNYCNYKIIVHYAWVSWSLFGDYKVTWSDPDNGIMMFCGIERLRWYMWSITITFDGAT